MKFGKLQDISGVNFELPEDHPRTARVLAEHSRPAGTDPKIFLGATGWGNKEWVGTWYPAKTPAREFLAHYSRQFSTIEFNSTHYRIPDRDTVERWYEMAAPGFLFCPKVPQQISHRARLYAPEPVQRFTMQMQLLQEKLGPTFLQLPEFHGIREANLVHQFTDLWPEDMELHWEFRHPSWFEGGQEAEETFDFLQNRRHGLVITDVAGRRDVLHMQLTRPSLVLRFVGNGLHPTDYDRTDAWIRRLAKWCDAGLHAAYLFIHQPDMDQVPEFTAYWARGLKEALGTEVTVPMPVGGSQPTLF